MYTTKLKLLVLCLFFTHVTFAQSSLTPDVKAANEVINDFLDTHVIPGMAVVVAKGGKIIYSQGFGWANMEQQVPIDPFRTKFRIGSISKPLSMLSLARLVEQGKVNLDQSVYDYVPDFPKKKYDFTVREVGGHIAGVRHYKGKEMLSNTYFPTVEDGLQIFKDDPLLFEPRTDYSYSSYGFNLLSAVIENAAGEPFLDYMQTEVIDELGLTQTVPEFKDSIIMNRTSYYDVNNDVIVNAEQVDNSYKWAGGGFISTAFDLVKMSYRLLDESYLQHETLKQFTQGQKLKSGKETNYGVGFRSGNLNGHDWWGHSGGSVGGTSYWVVFPDEELVVVTLANRSSLSYNGLPFNLANCFLPAQD